MMIIRTWILTLLLAGGAAPAVQAQGNETDWKRWTVRYYRPLDAMNDFNAGGLSDFLETNGFGGDSEGFFDNTLEYPLTRVEGGTGWSLLASYAYRPWLRLGASFHRAVDPVASGLRISPATYGLVGLRSRMWAAAPVATWTPVSSIAIGAGPALIRGTATFTDARITLGERMAPQEESFFRVGAVAFASLGFTILGTVHLGVQGQYLYGGEAEIGPFTLDEELFDLEVDALAGGVRIDQFTFGPMVAVHF